MCCACVSSVRAVVVGVDMVEEAVVGCVVRGSERCDVEGGGALLAAGIDPLCGMQGGGARHRGQDDGGYRVAAAPPHARHGDQLQHAYRNNDGSNDNNAVHGL